MLAKPFPRSYGPSCIKVQIVQKWRQNRFWQDFYGVEERSRNKRNLALPRADTFASKVAAIGDETADNSVGNVTGSNAVNVFLGIGIAWSIAAIFHESQGNDFKVSPGRQVHAFS